MYVYTCTCICSGGVPSLPPIATGMCSGGAAAVADRRAKRPSSDDKKKSRRKVYMYYVYAYVTSTSCIIA